MEKIDWTDDFSVNHELMDSQHQSIIKMVNQLIDNSNADVRSEIISELLNKLTEYALEHLRSEEKLMEEIGYPHLDEHKKLHKEYRLTVAEFCNATTYGVAEVPSALLAFISQWWSNHILIEDKKYGDSLATQS